MLHQHQTCHNKKSNHPAEGAVIRTATRLRNLGAENHTNHDCDKRPANGLLDNQSNQAACKSADKGLEGHVRTGPAKPLWYTCSIDKFGILWVRLQDKLEAAEDELFELETQWTAAKMRVQQLRVQARSAEEMALRTRSAAQACPAFSTPPLPNPPYLPFSMAILFRNSDQLLAYKQTGLHHAALCFSSCGAAAPVFPFPPQGPSLLLPSLHVMPSVTYHAFCHLKLP